VCARCETSLISSLECHERVSWIDAIEAVVPLSFFSFTQLRFSPVALPRIYSTEYRILRTIRFDVDVFRIFLAAVCALDWMALEKHIVVTF
jgi:hypothetical protein